jgi:hypothetical protein
MKVTNFGPDGLPITLAGWSTGITSLNSNVDITGGGPSALNFVQRITSNTSNTLLNPIVNFASGSNIAFAVQSNTLTIIGAAGGAGAAPVISAGSNSTRVREVSTAGASTTLWSPFDHAHDGIGTITASSSNTMQRGTWNIRPGAGIALSLTDTDGDGEFDTTTIVNTGVPGPAGSGGGSSLPTFVQFKVAGPGNTSLTLTMDAAPTNGNVIVLGSFSNGSAGLSTVVQTNVTWTKMVTGAAYTGTKAEIWIGKAAASAATLITITRTGGNAVWSVVEVSGVTVTPTVGVTVEKGGGSIPIPAVLPSTTAGNFICFFASAISQVVASTMQTSIPITGIPLSIAATACGFSAGAPISLDALTTDGAGLAVIACEVT